MKIFNIAGTPLWLLYDQSLKICSMFQKTFFSLLIIFYFLDNCQKATALAAATFRESTPCAIGIFTV